MSVTATDVVDLLTLFHDHQTTLHDRFAVAALEASAAAVAPMPCLLVHFHTTPTLREFCTLRNYLEAIAGTPVDLRPVLAP
jgi:hypothetical protein